MQTSNAETQQQDVAIQVPSEGSVEEDEERERLRSAATQWSDPDTYKKGKHNAATQWSPIDIFPLKSIPGYTGHLPGRQYVNPGKTFSQEVDTLLTTFHPKSAAVLPISRHHFTSALQQITEKKQKDDPYFDNRPPSTYANNYPIPGYQGFVPRVRTSTSSLGIRYIKAVERSLHALHEQKHHQKKQEVTNEDDTGNSPKKLLDKRPLHTPRHRPQPKQRDSNENDWRLIYKRPPSTYLDNVKTYIPGYKGYIPHLKASPNAVGIRYSKAAIRCLEASKPSNKVEQSNPKLQASKVQAQTAEAQPLQTQTTQSLPTQASANTVENKELTPRDLEQKYEDEIIDNKENAVDLDSDSSVDGETEEMNTEQDNRIQRITTSERPYREELSDFLKDRKPSTYRSKERTPIPGYQGFVPRLRDSPTTLGLRYTKAALKTLSDIHKNRS
ncbi:hypothetical protein X975_09466, partial [Stegodyphus mimosarum]